VYIAFRWGSLKEIDHWEDTRSRWEDNIKMNLKDAVLDGAEINDLEAQDRRKLRAFLIR